MTNPIILVVISPTIVRLRTHLFTRWAGVAVPGSLPEYCNCHLGQISHRECFYRVCILGFAKEKKTFFSVFDLLALKICLRQNNGRN